MDTPLPPFRPHRVQLVGHRDLGTVPARYIGCWLEIDHPEHGGRYGPAAVFRAEPVVEASRGALAWHKEDRSWNLCHPGLLSYRHAPYSAIQGGRAHSFCSLGSMLDRGVDLRDIDAAIAQITTWAREDGYEVPPWPGEAEVHAVPEPIERPSIHDATRKAGPAALRDGSAPAVEADLVPAVERLRYKGKTVDWRHVKGEARLYSDGSDRVDYLATVDTVGDRLRWCTFKSPSNLNVLSEGTAPTEAMGKAAAIRALIAEGVLTVEPEPAPKDRTVYDPDDIQRGDRHILSDGTRGTVLCVHDGWIAYTNRLPVVQHGGDIVRVEPFDPDDIPF